jgi:hypothetical protein
MGGGGDGGAANTARQAELQRETNINNGINARGGINDIFGQFNDAFYNKRRDSYLDYANPQLSDQYADAHKQLTYALDRNGTLDSTARTGQEANLSKLYGAGKTGISNQALDYENSARNNISNAKSDLVNELVSTGDNVQVSNDASSRAIAASQPDVYSPVSNVFSAFTGALGQQAAIEQANAYGGTGVGLPQIGRFNIGLYGPSPNAVVNTR